MKVFIGFHDLFRKRHLYTINYGKKSKNESAKKAPVDKRLYIIRSVHLLGLSAVLQWFRNSSFISPYLALAKTQRNILSHSAHGEHGGIAALLNPASTLASSRSCSVNLPFVELCSIAFPFSCCFFFQLFQPCDKPVKVTFKQPVLNNTIFFKFA